jgi:nitrate reductase delta subunit
MKNKPIQITRNSTSKIVPFETGETIYLLEEETELFDALASLLEYPTQDWFGKYEKCKNLIFLKDSFRTEYFSGFCLAIRKFSLLELQELYTRTFDLNPVCALEVGYHLFGEDYKRGEFLARLRETENPYELGQEQQLPDYLPVMLRLLGQMEDAEERAAMIGYCLIPALKMMSEALEKKKNVFGNIIKFLLESLKQVAQKSVQETKETEETKEARYQYV